MKRMIFVGTAAGLACLALTLKAQEPKSAGELSPEHKILAMEVGVWDADITLFMPGDDGKVTTSKSKGVETNHMFAGKWLISEFKGEMFGSNFEGYGQNGYDTKKGKYVATWVDTMSAHIDLLEGWYDEKTKTLTLNGDSENSADGKPMKMRLATQFNEDGTRTFTLLAQMDGQKEFAKIMEIKYTKRAK